jgi:hypothetical protein
MPIRDSEERKKYQSAWRRAKMIRVREFVNKQKDKPCTDCGVKYPSHVMDFDHCRGEKYLGISEMVSMVYTEEKLLEEIAKCDVVCANCHRERTHKRTIE